jgi:hypothetical protein
MNDRIAFTESENDQAENANTERRSADCNARGRLSDWNNSDWLCNWLKMAPERQTTN